MRIRPVFLLAVVAALSASAVPASASVAVNAGPRSAAGAAVEWPKPPGQSIRPKVLQWAIHNGRCVDIVGAATHSGAGLSLYNCHDDLNQQWRWTTLGEEPSLQLAEITSWDGRCMDTHKKGTADRTRVVVSTCDRHSFSQWWHFHEWPDGTFQIKSVHADKCLEVYKSRNTNGNAIEISTCTGGEDQRFRIHILDQP